MHLASPGIDCQNEGSRCGCTWESRHEFFTTCMSCCSTHAFPPRIDLKRCCMPRWLNADQQPTMVVRKDLAWLKDLEAPANSNSSCTLTLLARHIFKAFPTTGLIGRLLPELNLGNATRSEHQESLLISQVHEQNWTGRLRASCHALLLMLSWGRLGFGPSVVPRMHSPPSSLRAAANNATPGYEPWTSQCLSLKGPDKLPRANATSAGEAHPIA